VSNYTKISDFAAKDSMLTGNPLKEITGTAHDNEYNAISVAIATKVDSGGALGTPSSGTLTNCTSATPAFGDNSTKPATTEYVDRFRYVPQTTKSADYTLALADIGTSIDATSGAIIITIPANSSVLFPVGSVVTVTNTANTSISIAITTDTLRLAGTTGTGTRTLAGYGVATMRKVSSTVWIISGAGLS
jgi:hypothetical protein